MSKRDGTFLGQSSVVGEGCVCDSSLWETARSLQGLQEYPNVKADVYHDGGIVISWSLAPVPYMKEIDVLELRTSLLSSRVDNVYAVKN